MHNVNEISKPQKTSDDKELVVGQAWVQNNWSTSISNEQLDWIVKRITYGTA